MARHLGPTFGGERVRHQNIVILTGAGISAESGLSTFREEGGLWDRHRIEDVATPEGFVRDPDLVHEFYSTRRRQLKTASPNPAHIALGRLQREHGGQVSIVTQNVDDLHERGGASDVIHMHGELKKLRCGACHRVHVWDGVCATDTPCPACHAKALRPHVVWFGEMPFDMDRIMALLADCDLFMSIGTSGQVYPAAGFVSEVRQIGHAHTVEINLEPSDGASLFAERRHGPAGTLVPAYVEEILKGEPS